MAKRHRAGKDLLSEKPSSASAVRSTLSAVTSPAPSLRVSRSLCRLDTTVPRAMMVEMTPAQETGTPNPACMLGHADPSSESGSPKLMNAR